MSAARRGLRLSGVQRVDVSGVDGGVFSIHRMHVVTWSGLIRSPPQAEMHLMICVLYDLSPLMDSFSLKSLLRRAEARRIYPYYDRRHLELSSSAPTLPHHIYGEARNPQLLT